MINNFIHIHQTGRNEKKSNKISVCKDIRKWELLYTAGVCTIRIN